MRVLVVEDDFISRRLLCRYLQSHGECDVAVNGNEAVGAFKQILLAHQRYDLVCLDIMMPGMDGQETLKRLRKLEAEYGVPEPERAKVIMTTALEDHDNVMAAFSNACDGYVVKPIEKKKFLETLQEIGLPLTV
ncbi:MAG TPA: response regulator [Candidatus Krumholzibacteria bacterium]|nr:response regulator [Candidatus Krumholzibacteria bacterium]HPD73344.1 response regulator [Candidatus Krumholzibacteria bacterium]HRY42135.1 response regulator [Candidatus Krumholzibacteria bacterium]